MQLKTCLAAALAAAIALTPSSAPVRAQSTLATLLPLGKQCFQATTGITGMVGTIGTITGGSSYVTGTYGGVPLTGGSGSNATANITVAGGAVTAVTILNPGIAYVVGDVLSASAASIGGAGSGFSVPVASTSINSSLAGGSVGYYIPSTLTTKQTWQNGGETVLNINPVPLDANGCALVYGSGTYRQILKDSLNNTVWDTLTASTGSGSGSGGTTVGDGLPVGTILPWSGGGLPSSSYLYATGQAVSRSTYASLLTAITLQQAVVCQSGVSTVTVPTTTSDRTPIGAPIEAACFAPGTTVSSKSSGQLTLNNPATTSTSTALTVFPWGNGDGAITFNVPNIQGRVIAGRDNMAGAASGVLTSTYYLTPGGAGVNPDAMNAVAGSQSYVTTLAQLPTISSTATNNITMTVFPGGNASASVPTNTTGWSAQSVTALGSSAAPLSTSLSAISGTSSFSGTSSNTITVASTSTSSTPHPSVQPSVTADYIVKAIADSNISVATCSQLSNAGTACTANTGTSGHTVPFLDGTNVFSGTDSFTTATITGGSITGMPTPVNPSDVAIKSYVDAVAQGLTILAQTSLATAAVLPNTPTYSNGASGVGATLTAGSNTTLTVDGTVAALNTVVLVKNQASAFQNGIYTVTTAGGGVPWVLTRATYFNTAAQMKAGAYTFVTSGVTNSNTSWTQQAAVSTVGTDSSTWALFFIGGGAGVDSNVLAGGTVITSSPSVDSTFCAKTAALGGNAFYPFSVGAASGFAVNCVLTVANIDGWVSGRGKSLSVSGLALFSNILYPGQITKFRSVNNAWVQDPVAQFVRAPLNQKLFVDLAGSDANDCLATGALNACASLQHVVMEVIWGQLLATGGSATGGNAGFDVRLATDASCVITTGVNCHSGLHFSGAPKQLEGFDSILIECDGGSATNCTIADTVNAAIGLFNPAINMEIKNVTLAGGGSSNADIAATSGSIRIEGGVVLAPNAATSTPLLQADGLTGKIILEGGTTTQLAAGTSGYLALATYGGQVIMDSATVSLNGNVTFNQQTLACQSEALVSASGTTWTLNAHTVTTAHNINATTGCWVITNGGAANVPGTNAPIGTLTSAGSYN